MYRVIETLCPPPPVRFCSILLVNNLKSSILAVTCLIFSSHDKNRICLPYHLVHDDDMLLYVISVFRNMMKIPEHKPPIEIRRFWWLWFTVFPNTHNIYRWKLMKIPKILKWSNPSHRVLHKFREMNLHYVRIGMNHVNFVSIFSCFYKLLFI